MQQHGVARAVIEAVGPFRFLAVIHCYNGEESDYLELWATTPMEAVQAVNDAKDLLAKRGYVLSHTEFPAEVLTANLGGELRRYHELANQAGKLKQKLAAKRARSARLPLAKIRKVA